MGSAPKEHQRTATRWPTYLLMNIRQLADGLYMHSIMHYRNLWREEREPGGQHTLPNASVRQHESAQIASTNPVPAPASVMARDRIPMPSIQPCSCLWTLDASFPEPRMYGNIAPAMPRGTWIPRASAYLPKQSIGFPACQVFTSSVTKSWPQIFTLDDGRAKTSI